jgi:hypothetical protein
MRHQCQRTLGALAAVIASGGAAMAGNGANFVTYDHHTEEKGVTEIKVYNDLGRTADDHVLYNAQLFELEHAFSDQMVVALYLESQKDRGEDAEFNSFRIEGRYRLFAYRTPFNPVVYVEYVHKREGALYLREVVGRTASEAGSEASEHEDEGKRENEIETKLILGHDFNDRLRFGFDWISEVNLKSGDWAFGYATGLTYTLFENEAGQREGSHESHGKKDWSLKEVALGAELFGGAGDSVKGLTLDGSETQHYAGVSLKTEFENGAQLMLGGAFGLTGPSQDAIFRAMFGWEFE